MGHQGTGSAAGQPWHGRTAHGCEAKHQRAQHPVAASAASRRRTRGSRPPPRLGMPPPLSAVRPTSTAMLPQRGLGSAAGKTLQSIARTEPGSGELLAAGRCGQVSALPSPSCCSTPPLWQPPKESSARSGAHSGTPLPSHRVPVPSAPPAPPHEAHLSLPLSGHHEGKKDVGHAPAPRCLGGKKSQTPSAPPPARPAWLLQHRQPRWGPRPPGRERGTAPRLPTRPRYSRAVLRASPAEHRGAVGCPRPAQDLGWDGPGLRGPADPAGTGGLSPGQHRSCAHLPSARSGPLPRRTGSAAPWGSLGHAPPVLPRSRLRKRLVRSLQSPPACPGSACSLPPALASSG